MNPTKEHVRYLYIGYYPRVNTICFVILVEHILESLLRKARSDTIVKIEHWIYVLYL